MNTSRLLIAIGAAALIPPWGGVLAQDLDYEALEGLFNEPVTTSVTGSPQRASDAAASMLIITADDIRRSGARDIPGVLTRLAGIDVRRRTNDHADVSVRGYNQAFTPRLLVLVDGRQVYADYYGFTPWSTVPVELEAIRQIEVVKGPNGALFGFNAVGGVVNIVTYDPFDEGAESTVVSRMGTQDLAEVSAVKSFRLNDDTAIRVSAGSRRSDDFATPLEPADVGSRRGNEREALSADAHLALSPNVTLGLEASFSSASQAEVPPTYSLSYTDYETHSLRTHWSADTRFGLLKANLYRNSIKADAFLMDGEAPFRTFDNEVTIAQLEDVFKIGPAHIVRVAGEYRENSMATTPIEGAEISYDVLSLTAMWNWRLSSSISLTNAVRVDDWSLGRTGFIPSELEAEFGLTNDVWDISRDELSFNSGLVWRTPRAGAFRLIVARAQQLPNLLNLGGEFSNFFGFYFLGIPWLEPTAVTNYEVDWEHSLGATGTRVRLAGFHGDTRDVQSMFFGNMGSSATTGFEATIAGEFPADWHWSASYLSQSIDDRLADTFPVGLTLVDFERTSPEGVLKAHLGWTRGRWEADGYLRYMSSFHGLRGPNPGQFEASLVPVPRHATLDARLGYVVGERTTLAISGQNLAGSTQRQTSAPEVERRIFATVRFSF